MIISTCGFGNTGASAVLDFLKGYDRVSVSKDIEFQIIHMPDGLLDLKYYLTQNRDRVSCNAAIMRFLRLSDSIFATRLHSLGCEYKELAEEFVKSLNPITWDGKSAYDPMDVSGIKHGSLLNRLKRLTRGVIRHIFPNWHSSLFKKRYFLFVDEKTFDDKAKLFLKKIFSSLGYDAQKDMLFDMLVSGADPNAGTEFLDENKIIVVYRDPKDLYVRTHSRQSTNGYMPCSNVNDFIRYYKMLMTYSKPSQEALYIQYEDLIYNYYPTTNKIMDFLGYDSRPENEFKYFNPDISVKYTNNECEDTDDINMIKKELSMYLYDFQPYISVEEQKRAFEGDMS